MSLANKFNIPEALLQTIKNMNEGKEEYQAKVKALMAKRGIKSLADLSPEEKKDFFNTLDSMHKAKNEEIELDEAIPKSTSHALVHSSSKKIIAKGNKAEMMKKMKELNAKEKGSHHLGMTNRGKVGDTFGEEVELEEGKSGTGYELYHKDFSSAMQHAYDFAKKKYNIEIDPTEIDRNVAMGPKKPSSGKANAYRLLDKTGKKAIQVQVANLDNKRYELNMYKEEVEELDELSKDTLKSYTDKASSGKDVHNNPKKNWLNRISGLGRASEKLKKEEVDLEEGYEKTVLDFLDKRGFNSADFRDGNLYVSKSELAGVKKALQRATGFNAKDLKVIAEEQIDELKRSTLASYIDKAAADAVDLSSIGKEKRSQKLLAKSGKRLVNVGIAARKLAATPKKLDSRIQDVIKKIQNHIEFERRILGHESIDIPDFMKAISLLKKGNVDLAIRHAMNLDSDPRDFLLTVMEPIGSLVGKRMREEVELTEKGPGLWANIRAKRARGEKMRKPGEKGAPTEDQIKSARNEEVELTESHFKPGQRVMCIKSGMKGTVIKVNKPEVGKYYDVTLDSGKKMKYAPDELKLIGKMPVKEEEGASKKKETEFHKKLDTLVHKTFGKRPEEMKEEIDFDELSEAKIDKHEMSGIIVIDGHVIRDSGKEGRSTYGRYTVKDPDYKPDPKEVGMHRNYRKPSSLSFSTMAELKKWLKTQPKKSAADIEAIHKKYADREKMYTEESQIDEISADVAKRVAQKRDQDFRKGTPTATQKRRMGRGDWRADPSLHADKARQSAEKRGAKDVYDYNKKEEVEFDEASNPQISMKRAGLSVQRAKEVMRHQKEIGSIRKKREALRNSYDPSMIEAYKKMKNKKEVTEKEKSKSVNSGDKLSGKQEPIEIDPELKEQKT